MEKTSITTSVNTIFEKEIERKTFAKTTILVTKHLPIHCLVLLYCFTTDFLRLIRATGFLHVAYVCVMSFSVISYQPRPFGIIREKHLSENVWIKKISKALGEGHLDHLESVDEIHINRRIKKGGWSKYLSMLIHVS